MIYTGTSMATPVLAGTIVLVRQYFEEGYYPSGHPNAANSIHPSASLLKAVTINDAFALSRRRRVKDNVLLHDVLPATPNQYAVRVAHMQAGRDNYTSCSTRRMNDCRDSGGSHSGEVAGLTIRRTFITSCGFPEPTMGVTTRNWPTPESSTNTPIVSRTSTRSTPRGSRLSGPTGRQARRLPSPSSTTSTSLCLRTPVVSFTTVRDHTIIVP